jgi:succinate-acetate transporter protein
MRKRIVGRIVLAVLTVLFAVLCVIYAISANDVEEIHHVGRAIAWGILSLTSATFYRYFED